MTFFTLSENHGKSSILNALNDEAIAWISSTYGSWKIEVVAYVATIDDMLEIVLNSKSSTILKLKNIHIDVESV